MEEKYLQVGNFLESVVNDYFKDNEIKLAENEKIEIKFEIDEMYKGLKYNSEEDFDFVLNNNKLYKKFIYAILSNDSEKLLKISNELLELLSISRGKEYKDNLI